MAPENVELVRWAYEAWNGQDPDANYSFGSAPTAIQQDLLNFISSITKNGQIHPAVHSISIGNELDLGIDTDPGITSKMRRALWWAVNLHDQLQQQFGANVPTPFLTIPVSNADQGNASVSQRSWFQVFLHGAKAGDPLSVLHHLLEGDAKEVRVARFDNMQDIDAKEAATLFDLAAAFIFAFVFLVSLNVRRAESPSQEAGLE